MLLERVTAFGSGVVAAGAAAICAVLLLGASPMPYVDADAGSDHNVVCMGSDSVLRVPPEGSDDCPAGTRPLDLAGPSHDADKVDCSNCDPWGEKPPAAAAAVNERLAAIERRLKQLEAASLFEVVDKQGRKVMTVGPQSLALYYPGDRSATDIIRATPDGGSFTASNGSANLLVSVGASPSAAGMRILEDGVVRVDLGRQSAGNYALRLLSPKGLAAAIGQSRAGSGAVLVGDVNGTVRASLQIAGDKGAVGLFGASSTALVSMTEGATGGGLLVLGDRTGEPMVKMGVNKGSYGAVLTGPRAGFPYVPRSGLPGSYFFGCAPGPACQP